MSLYIHNAAVLIDDRLTTDCAVRVSGDRIVAVGRDVRPDPGDRRVDGHGRALLPGFIDTQVNGGGGVLFNDAPNVGGIAAIASAHRRFGTTAVLPTLISDDLPVVATALDAVDAAIAAGVPGVVGIHLEGPFLAASRRGIHDTSHFRALDANAFDLLEKPRRGRVLLTLAPECTSPDTIRRLVAAGVRVSLGHSDATCEEAQAAFAAGATGVTHLFNAMSPLTARAPGVVGAALADPTAWCGLIVDGRHVSPVTLRIALAARPHDRFVLVTDAMPCVGTDADGFMLGERRIEVRDGACVDAHGTLAGSAIDMLTAVRNAARFLSLTFETAARMASEYPAAFLGLSHARGRIAPGLRADLMLVDETGAPEVYVGGERLD
jgi:N-acetylglucosamine-6-phosphate deacetylase